MTWRDCLLGDVITLKRGYDLPDRLRESGDVPIISSSGISGAHAVAKVKGPGVVTGRYGTLGEVFYVPTAFWPLNTALYVVDFKGNDPRFVSYWLRLQGLGSQNAAGAVPGVNRNHLHQLAVKVPDVGTQRCIASILSAYDDLIENNTRRIAILEEMARRIFEEWFVHFRAPGCEGQPMFVSTLGPIPRGWEVRSVGSLFRTSSGGTPSRKRPEFFGGEIPWVKTKELLDGPIFVTEERITQDGLDNSSARIFPAFSVLVAMYGANIGQLGVLIEDAATNQACCAIIAEDRVGWAYAYLSLLNARRRLIGLRAGAAQQNISQAIIREFSLLHAPDDVHDRFEEHVQRYLRASFNLHRQNANLRAQRDLLLPKLISGEIDVSVAPPLLEAAE